VWFLGGKMLAVFRRTSCQICAVKHSNEKCSAPSFSGPPSLQGPKKRKKENNKAGLSQPHNQRALGMEATLPAFLCSPWNFMFPFLFAQRFSLSFYVLYIISYFLR